MNRDEACLHVLMLLCGTLALEPCGHEHIVKHARNISEFRDLQFPF